jgi:hypothetical protein
MLYAAEKSDKVDKSRIRVCSGRLRRAYVRE